MKGKILIVEDEALIALEIQKRLRQLGHEVCGIASCDAAAMTLAAEQRPDLVLMDIRLAGGLDGIEVAAMIRERLEIPTVYLTAHVDEMTLERAKQTDPYGFLAKPFRERDLRIGIEMALHRRATELRARESEEMFRLVTESIDDVFWLSSPDQSKVYYVSPAYERLWGRSRESLYRDPKSFLDRVHEDDLGGVLALLDQPATEVREVEYRLARPDGSVRWVKDRRFPARDAQGHCQQLACIITDVTEQREAREKMVLLNEKLQEQATHDMLTGLPNRRLFIDRLDQALAHARRFGGRVGMLFIDLDGFKGINDRFGHQAGDEVLLRIGKRIKLLLREVDTAARLGGDEFGIVLPDIVQIEDAELVGDKVLIEVRRPFSVRNVCCEIGASIGITVFPDHGGTADELISHADAAMYRIKQGGVGGVEVYRDSDKPISREESVRGKKANGPFNASQQAHIVDRFKNNVKKAHAEQGRFFLR
ncbi:MAG: diguanylate cyclase [Syntrophotaleaceae bacterium]